MIAGDGELPREDVVSGEIERVKAPTSDSHRGIDDMSPLSVLSVGDPRRNATSSTAHHPNHLLLSICPDLVDFWDGNAWVVTSQRLEKAALKAGIHPTLPSPTDIPDLFSTRLPYSSVETLRVQGAELALKRDVLFIDEILGSNLMDTLELESYAAKNTTTFQPLEANFDIVSLQVTPPQGIEIDRSVAGDRLLSRIIPVKNERLRSIADKVAQRNLLSAFSKSEIEQPKYLDARAVNPPDSCVEFHHVSFSNFPVKKIASTPKSAKKIWVFEDCRQGFAVVSDGKRQYVHSENTIARELIRKHKLQSGARSGDAFSIRLDRFLTELSERSEYRVCLLRPSPHLESERLKLARSILEYDGEVFVKSSRSSDGILVLQVTGRKGHEPVIQSDSVEVGELLKQYLLQIESVSLAKSGGSVELFERLVVTEDTKAVRKRSSMEGFLEKALSCMEAPIVEDAIPVARFAVPQGVEKVECRLIFQGTERVELVGHYVKASPNKVAANIACGGHSRRTFDVMYGLHNQHLEGSVPPDEIDRRAARSFERLQEHASRFARACADHYRQLMPQRPLCDFALDICPVWDQQRGTLRFFLLEIQFTYGYSGLTTAVPMVAGPTAEDLMAHRVRAFKSTHETESESHQMLRQIEANFELLRSQLGLLETPDSPLPKHAALRLLQRRLMEEL